MPKENTYSVNDPNIVVELYWYGHAPEGHVHLTTANKDLETHDGEPVKQHYKGFEAILDREGINRLIRLLRRARDSAYGADA